MKWKGMRKQWLRSINAIISNIEARIHESVLGPWLITIPITLFSLLLVTQSSPEIDAGLLHHDTDQDIVQRRSETLSRQKKGADEDPAWRYFRPSWTSSLSLAKSFLGGHSDDPLGEWGIDAEELVEDPNETLEPDFRVPDYLKDRVVFWIRTYSQYNHHMRIVHDRNQLNFVYGIIDFRPLFRDLGRSAKYEIRAASIEKKILHRLKDQIILAASQRTTSTLNPEIQSLRSLLSRYGALEFQAAQHLCNNLRTQTGQRDEFLAALRRAGRLLPHIESVLRINGLPITLARIPFVESSFNATAQSKIGAVGIWQFTPETAREWIAKDEEKLWSDPIRQTRSAARLLKGYRTLLPDWSTTVTAYNSGVGRLRRLTERYKTVTLEKLLVGNSGDELGFAGKNFYAEVLAATIVEAYKEEIFGKHLLPEPEVPFHFVPTSDTIDRCTR